MKRFPRHVLSSVLNSISSRYITVVTGARQVGKTVLCSDILPTKVKRDFTYINFDDPDERLRFQRDAISIFESIKTALVIIDEVQKLPSIFNPFKFVYDKYRLEGIKQTPDFILTGSSRFLLLKQIHETLAGRVSMIDLWPLSIGELQNTNHDELLVTQIWKQPQLCSNLAEKLNILSPEIKRTRKKLTTDHQKWGGFPPLWEGLEGEQKISWLRNYRISYMDRDLADIGGVRLVDLFGHTLNILASRSAQILSYSNVARDLAVSVNTIKRYVRMMSLTYQLYLVYPFSANIAKRYVKSPKLFFPDVGLVRLLTGRWNEEGGAIFENWVFSELMKWKSILENDPELYFYRTASGAEIDFILKTGDHFLPVEIKGSNKVHSVDIRHIRKFMDAYPSIPVGLLVYRGDEMYEISPNIWAVPDWALFSTVEETFSASTIVTPDR